MADETAVVPAAIEAEPSATFDTAQLDAILEKMRPMPKDDSAPPVAPVKEPITTPEPETPVTPAVEPVEAPKPAAPAGPFDPPPSVLGEVPAKLEATTDPIEQEYGTLPEQPPPEFKSKEAKESYAKMRQNHEKLKSDFRAAREAAKQKPPPDEGMAAQLADLTARNAELNAIVERSAIESHPYVRQQFDEPRKQLFNIAAGALKKVDIDPSRLGKILSLDGKDRVDAMDELYGEIESPTTREKVTNAIAQIDMLEEKKVEFLADRQGNVERMTQAEKAERYRQIASQQENVKGMLSEVVDEITNKFKFPFLKEASDPGSEQWNERVQQDKRWLEFMALENTDPREQLKCNALARQAPYLLQAWQAERVAKMELEKKVAEYEGAMPSLNGNSATEKVSATGTMAKDDDEMTAAGILPTDSLAVQSRKLAAYWNRNGTMSKTS